MCNFSSFSFNFKHGSGKSLENLDSLKSIVKLQSDAISPKAADNLVNLSCKIQF